MARFYERYIEVSSFVKAGNVLAGRVIVNW
jgi:hypothetical protein